MSKQIQDLRARYNANGNAIIPNTFQHPNIFVDRLMYYLSPIENVVLTFAVRRILGFQDNIMSRKDNISISQFTDGITAEDGRALSMGCGIGVDATINALDALAQFKILLPATPKPDPHKGQEYWLQDNEKAIDWEGLEARKSEKIDKYRKQTQKARYSVQQNPSVEQNAGDSVEQNDSPLLNRNTKPTETHANPIKEGASATLKATDFPEVVLFHSVTGRYPSKDTFRVVVESFRKISARLNRAVVYDDLLPFWEAWRIKDYRKTNLSWLTDWAVAGKVKPNGNGKNKPNINDIFKEYAQEQGLSYGD